MSKLSLNNPIFTQCYPHGVVMCCDCLVPLVQNVEVQPHDGELVQGEDLVRRGKGDQAGLLQQLGQMLVNFS